jgi:hypothetical protein
MKFVVAKALFWAGAALGLASGSAVADSRGQDAWESFPPADLHNCYSIDNALVIPVPAAHRSEALRG